MFKKALAIAAAAHAGQMDKAGKPYMDHVIRVALGVPCGDAKIVALLHDVVEDSCWSLGMLKAEGFSDVIVAAVAAMTHKMGESYDDYIERVKLNPLATVVKLSDLADNTDDGRLPVVDLARILKYAKAKSKLEGK